MEVRREAEWSSEDRNQVEALILLEQLTCTGCGSWLPHSTDPRFVALVDTGTCYGCRSMQIVQRTDADRHREDPHPAAGRPGWSDGLRYGVRPASKAEVGKAIRPE